MVVMVVFTIGVTVVGCSILNDRVFTQEPSRCFNSHYAVALV